MGFFDGVRRALNKALNQVVKLTYQLEDAVESIGEIGQHKEPVVTAQTPATFVRKFKAPAYLKDQMETVPDTPFEWDPPAERVWRDVAGRGWNDEEARLLFNIGYVEHGLDLETRGTARELLEDRMRDVYGIEFYDDFDWTAWKQWYEVGASR